MAGLKLMGELGLDGSGFERGFAKAEGLAHGVAHGLKSVVVQAVGIGAVEQAIEKTVESARELVETSERLAIAPEQLQVLRQAAKDSGVEFEKLVGAFEKIDIARQKALGGDNQSMMAFHAFGISRQDLQTQTASQLFTGQMRNKALETNPEQLGIIFRELGIKSFGGLIPVLKTNFDELGAKMKAIGAIMDTETAVKLKNLSTEFSLLGQIITAQLGPAMIKLAEFIYSTLLKTGKTVAGAAAAAGAGTAGMSAGQTAVGLGKALGIGVQSLWHRATGSMTSEQDTAWVKQQMGKAGFNVKAMEGATKTAQEPWMARQKQFEDLLEKMAAQAKELDHPKPPDLSTPTLDKKMSKKALETPTDSLVKIGNFFGGSGAATARLAERRTKLLEKIENNTKPKPMQPSLPRGTNYPENC